MRSPWSSPALFGLLTQMLLSSGVIGGELGHFQARTPVQAAGIQLLQAEDSRWRVESDGARQVIRLEPSTDYYSRAAFHLVLEAAPTGGCGLVLEFLDRGYGAIALSPGVGESSQWSVARVNTGKLRRAVYRLLGIRLGPSGDYGEAQYPAKGPGYKFRAAHTHIGYWAADDYAQAAFRNHLKEKYGQVSKLNAAWESGYDSFEQVGRFLPETAVTRRKRIDFADWYMGAMSQWCEQWAVWARQALPRTTIHQSSGGWGHVQIGTDYSHQARSMMKIGGGMRLTNEGDDFPDNFTITRMASSAARFYGIPLGYEPGGFGSKRGVMARLFNAVTTDAVHLFYYLGNLTGNDQALDAWLQYAPLLDLRALPVIEVAAFYPDTAIKLDDELVRYRWASTFFTVGRTLREQVDFDYASEQMILDGALDRYKVLLFLWGAVTEQAVLERMDQWVRTGGTVVFAGRPRGMPATVEDDSSIATKWLAGDTGKGRAVLWRGDLIPSQSYAEFIRDLLLKTPSLRPEIKTALQMEQPAGVYWGFLTSGKLALLNFNNHSATVRLASGTKLLIPAYGIAME